MIKTKKNINIAIVGLGQIGNYLYNELISKSKKKLRLNLEKKLKLLRYLLGIKTKKENSKSIKKYSIQIPL